MGWKGTLRSINAAASRYDRAQKTRQRELERQRKQYEKMQALEKAVFEVQEFDNYLDVILSIHKECDDEWDWEEIANIPPPNNPVKLNTNEEVARKRFEDYNPSFMDKTLKRVEKRIKVLEEEVNYAKERDEEIYQNELNVFQESIKEWGKTKRIADGIVEGNIESYSELITEVNPLDEISELGSSIQYRYHSKDGLEVDLYVNSEQVVPMQLKTLLKSGKLSIKAMPKTRFYEIYQDYVCGAVLRVAREMFALLPLKMIIVNAYGELLDTSTGHTAPQPILSVAFPKEVVKSLNFDYIDPSDSLVNFSHNMKFLKTKGFSGVERLQLKDVL